MGAESHLACSGGTGFRQAASVPAVVPKIWRPNAGSAFPRVHPELRPWGCSGVLSYRGRKKEAKALGYDRDS